jgi:hypothetical protein
MVLLSSVTSKFNRFVAPRLLKSSLLARYQLSRNKPLIIDNPYVDAFFLIPLSQKIISIEVQQVAKEREKEEKATTINNNKKKDPSAVDDFVDRVWDRYLEGLSPTTTENENEVDIHNAITRDANNNNNSHRVKAFIEYMRPVLTPNNVFDDLNTWRFNNRFAKWIRAEYLICKYEGEIRDILSIHPKLKYSAVLSQARSRIRDTMRYGLSADMTTGNSTIQHAKSLPSVELLNDAFGMHDWIKTKSTVGGEYDLMSTIAEKELGGTMHEIPGSNVLIPEVDGDKNISHLPFEHLLELTGCHVSSCNAFNALCDDAGIYEFWTDEYVQGLTGYLIERCRDLSQGDDDCKDVVIVDVGAGDGLLTKIIREKIAKSTMNRKIGKNRKQKKIGKNESTSSKKKRDWNIPKVIATDDGSWSIMPKADVVQLNVKEAMDEYNPHVDESGVTSKRHHLIVICSWMPMGEDWSAYFRSVDADEYILIGECDDGSCGDNWLTWGNKEFHVDQDKDEMNPHVMDGYYRNELDNLSKLQFSRFDSAISSSSKTISFRRSSV